MSANPFSAPGADVLQSMVQNPSPTTPDNVFVKSGNGSGVSGAKASSRRKTEEADKKKQEEFDREKEEYIAQQDDDPQEDAVTVTLKNLRWGCERGVLGETANALVDVDLPASISNLTRIVYTLEQKTKDGIWQQIKRDKLEAHVKDGVAELQIQLPEKDKTQKSSAQTKSNTEEHFRFSAKHSKSKQVFSPELPADMNAPDFEGDIFYLPLTGEYMMIEKEEDLQTFKQDITRIDAATGGMRHLAEIAELKEKEKKRDELHKEMAELFEGEAALETATFEEAVQVRRSKRWGNHKGWIYITPHVRKNASVKGHIRKEQDTTLKKALDKMLNKGKGEEHGSVFDAKIKQAFFKTDPVAGGWPWPWHYPDKTKKSEKENGNEKKKEESKYLVFSTEAATCRYLMGFKDVETELDLKERKLSVSTGGHLSYSLFEGKMEGSLSLPTQQGINLFHYLDDSTWKDKTLLKANRECWVLVNVYLGAEAFVGVSLKGTLDMPNIDLGKKTTKKDQKAEVGVGGEGFAGAQAGVSLGLSLKWKPKNDFGWLDLAKENGKIVGIVGANAVASIKLSYRDGKFYYHHEFGAALAIGLKNSVEFELNAEEAFQFAGHLLTSIDYHKLGEIEEAAFVAYKNYAFTRLTEGKAKAQAMGRAAIEGFTSFKGWLSDGVDSLDKTKKQIFDSSDRWILSKCPDHAIAQCILTVMEKYSEDDFRVLRNLLISSDSDHKFKWILRRVGNPELGVNESVSDTEKERLLRLGIQKIRTFANYEIEKTAKRESFLAEFNQILHSHNIPS